MQRIYLDHAATTPLAPEVLEAMLPHLRERFGNPSSRHTSGREAAGAVEGARANVARLLGCEPSEIIFTGGGTESDNLAIFGAAMAKPGTGHLVTSVMEHHAVSRPAESLQAAGWEVARIPVDPEGLLDPSAVKAAIRPDTAIVSIQHASNEVGTVQPIAEIGRICREAGVPFHTDAVQTVGHVPCRADDLGVDLLSLSSHKLYGPQGVGALYLRRGVRIAPIVFGGGHERGLRSGTENVAGIVGLGRAAELAMDEMESRGAREARLRDRLLREIPARIPCARATGSRERRLPGSASFVIEGMDPESLLGALDAVGIEASSGSACTSGSLEPSHVLLAMGLPPALALGALRLTLGRGTTEEDVDRVLEELPPVVAEIRATRGSSDVVPGCDCLNCSGDGASGPTA